MSKLNCEHEYENDNCTNCANGLPCSAYECNKTKGTLKEYCHERAEGIHRQKYNEGYEQGILDVLELPVYRWGVSMLSTEEYMKVSDIEQFLKKWCSLNRN